MKGDEVRGLNELGGGGSEEGKVTKVIEGTEKDRRLIGKRRAKEYDFVFIFRGWTRRGAWQ